MHLYRTIFYLELGATGCLVCSQSKETRWQVEKIKPSRCSLNKRKASRGLQYSQVSHGRDDLAGLS
jgi:hypothetical protein